VGHHEGGLPLPLEPEHQVPDVVDPDGVEAGGGLVEKDVLRVRRQGPGDGDPLLHAAGKLRRVEVDGLLQPHEGELLQHDPLDLLLGQPPFLQEAVPHVLPHGHGVEEGATLEDDGDLPPNLYQFPLPESPDGGTIDGDGSPVGPQQSQHQLQDCGLAGPAHAEDGPVHPRLQVEVETVQNPPPPHRIGDLVHPYAPRVSHIIT
jgi:hypothetical protein